MGSNERLIADIAEILTADPSPLPVAARDTPVTMESDCPCGSGMSYDGCCGRLHSGTATAQSALELMRSRYSAFVVGDAGYLLATWHPATRPASLELDPTVQWRRLQIRDVSAGGEDDVAGTVEFIAHFWDSVRGEYGRQHENSRFVRQGGRWFYVEAVS